MQGPCILIAMIGMLMFGHVSADTILYKYTDEDGRVYFTDRPPVDAQAEQITIRVQSFDGEATVTEHANAAARPETITIYTADWCRICHRAKDYMKEKGYSFRERDIEKSRSAKLEFDRLGGKGVPVILVGGKRMNGFSPGKLEQLLADN